MNEFSKAASKALRAHKKRHKTQGWTMKTKAMKTGMLVGLLALSASLLGCAVQTKWGARDVAFDFSDHDYYDKSFAPSSLAASHTLEGIDSVASGTNEQQVSGTAAETTR